MARPNLDSLPIEILQDIAIRTTSEILGPPSRIIPLLLTSKSFHDRLAFRSHPTLWAAIFDNCFDTAALTRRFPATRLTATLRAEELRNRWICLKRIRETSTGLERRQTMVWGYPNAPGTYHTHQKLEDAWLVFMMITESDGLNADQLFKWARAIHWIRSLVYYELNLTAVESQRTKMMPVYSELRSIGLWLYWFIMRYHHIVSEEIVSLSAVNRMLRPYAFGSFQYPSFCAPWPFFHLPTCNIKKTQDDQQEGTTNGPTIADSTLRSQMTTIPCHFGSPLPLAIPLIHTASVLLFCSRMQKFPLGQQSPNPDDIQRMNSPQYLYGHRAYTPIHGGTRFPSHCNSRTYDNDVLRILSCGNPTVPRSPNLPRYRYIPGALTGEWEGRFVIYGLDAHQNIMEGVSALGELERTILTQDPQAWRMREYIHPSLLRKLQLHLGSRTPHSLPGIHQPGHRARHWQSPSQSRPPIPPGLAMKAHIPQLPVKHVQNGLEIGVSGQEVFYQEVQALDVEEQFERGRSIDDLIGSYNEEDRESDGIEIIVEGEAIRTIIPLPGRESMMEPGSTVLGTIRLWDGLITLLANPIHPRSGQWLYRGYITANGNWVGRWRDTWNDVDREGYEGIFSMSRR